MTIEVGKFIDTIGENAVRIRGNLYMKDSQLSQFKGHGDIQVPRGRFLYFHFVRTLFPFATFKN